MVKRFVGAIEEERRVEQVENKDIRQPLLEPPECVTTPNLRQTPQLPVEARQQLSKSFQIPSKSLRIPFVSTGSPNKRRTPKSLARRKHQYERVTLSMYEDFFDNACERNQADRCDYVHVEDSHYITLASLKACTKRFHWNVSEVLVEKLFTAFDADPKDGKLQRSEFISLVGWEDDVHALHAWEKVAMSTKTSNEATIKTLCTKLSIAVRDKSEANIQAFETAIQNLEDIWRNMTPHMFTRMLSSLSIFENDPVEFLDSFALKVCRTRKAQSESEVNYVSSDADHMQPFRAKLRSNYDLMMVETDVDYRWDQDRWTTVLRKQFQQGRPAPFSSRWLTWGGAMLFAPRSAREYRFVYTTASWLFDPRHESEFAHIAQSFKDMGVESGVFGTFAARACLLQAWHCVEDIFVLHVILDAYFVVLLILLGLDGHENNHSAPILVILLAIGVCRNILCLVVEFLAAADQSEDKCFRFCGRHIMGVYFGSMQTGLLFIGKMSDIVCSITLVYVESRAVFSCSRGLNRLDWDDLFHKLPVLSSDGCDKSFMQEYPTVLAYLVGTKCSILGHYLLATRFLGVHVIPAYRALVDTSHRSFVGYLMLVQLSCFAAYFMIPIKGGELNDVVWTFLTMFRLCFSGDFDMGDLEGVNQIVVLDKYNRSSHQYTGYTDDGEPDSRWHLGMSFLFCILTVFVNVMLLNVYIGLLSELYTKYASQKEEHFEAFRSHISWKLLLAQRGWRKLLKALCLGRCVKKDKFDTAAHSVYDNVLTDGYGQKSVETVVNTNSHIWIAYNPALFKKKQDLGESMSDLTEKMMKQFASLRRNTQPESTSHESHSNGTPADISTVMGALNVLKETMKKDAAEKTAAFEKIQEQIRELNDKVDQVDSRLEESRVADAREEGDDFELTFDKANADLKSK